MTTENPPAEVVEYHAPQAGPYHSPTSPSALVHMGAKMTTPSTGLSTVAARALMDKLTQINTRVAVESTDAVLEAVNAAIDARWTELEQAILMLPATFNHVNRDKVLSTIYQVRNRPARI